MLDVKNWIILLKMVLTSGSDFEPCKYAAMGPTNTHFKPFLSMASTVVRAAWSIRRILFLLVIVNVKIRSDRTHMTCDIAIFLVI